MTTKVVSISADGHVAITTDGTTWSVNSSLNAISVSGWSDICWSPALNKFCAINSSGTQSATSSDGVTWSTGTLPSSSFFALAWSPSLGAFCAVNNSTGQANNAATSTDGLTWTAHSIGQLNNWQDICWSPSKSLFLALSNSGTNQLATSPDGATWTLRTQPFGSLQVCAWDPTGAQFCISCFNTNQSATSPDGITWTSHASNTPLNAGNHKAMIALAAGGFMVGMGAQTIATSTDGSTWASNACNDGAASSTNDLTYSTTLSEYLAAMSGGTDGAITSPTGATWTAQGGLAATNAYIAMASGDVAVVPFIHQFGTVIC